jgi:hypothetical protein
LRRYRDGSGNTEIGFSDSLLFTGNVTASKTERMRLDASGNLFLGNTGSSAPSVGFDAYISYDAADASGLAIGHANGSASGNRYISFVYNSTQIGSITQNSTSGVLYNITSDYRLKTVTGPVTNAGSRIDSLKPIDYLWKDGGQQARGFLAHEFQEVYPNSVTGAKDSVDEDGKPVYQNMQASTSEVIADLVAEIQSLRIRIAQLENKL